MVDMVTVDGTSVTGADLDRSVAQLLDALEAVDGEGWYSALEVVRPWSEHNPRIVGEFARPGAIRRYLRRELAALLGKGAIITAKAARAGLSFNDPEFFA